MPWINRLPRLLRGPHAERAAEKYLCKQGLILVQRNYRCKRGELDLIMREHGVLVFVEVKYRSNSQHGHPAEYFDSRKRRKVIATIHHYLQVNRINPGSQAQRIDLVAIDGEQINWLKNV